MPVVKGRVNRTGVADAVPLYARVHPQQRAKAQRIADALGVSLATYIDKLLDREELDEHGRPVWWPHTDKHGAQEELPLSQSA